MTQLSNTEQHASVNHSNSAYLILKRILKERWMEAMIEQTEQQSVLSTLATKRKLIDCCWILQSSYAHGHSSPPLLHSDSLIQTERGCCEHTRTCFIIKKNISKGKFEKINKVFVHHMNRRDLRSRALQQQHSSFLCESDCCSRTTTLGFTLFI